MKDQLLRQMANTIVANLGNTTEIGLFNGKMGVAIFLYEYARYSGCEIYSEIADRLIDEIYAQINIKMSHDVTDGLASVGIGLIYLLKEQLLEGEPDEVLDEIDKYLLGICDGTFEKHKNQVTSFSEELYLLYRLKSGWIPKKNDWLEHLIWLGETFISTRGQKATILPELSLANSMLFVYSELYKQYPIRKLNHLLSKLFDFVASVVKNIPITSDSYIFQEICDSFSDELLINSESVKKIQIDFDDTILIEFPQDYWWWKWLYNFNLYEDFPRFDLLNYVNKKIKDYPFEETTLNSHFSGLGVELIQKKDGRINL